MLIGVFSLVYSAHANEDGQNGASVRDAAELQAMATQSSSVAFLQRTIKSLRTENERMRHELAALEAGDAQMRRADVTRALRHWRSRWKQAAERTGGTTCGRVARTAYRLPCFCGQRAAQQECNSSATRAACLEH